MTQSGSSPVLKIATREGETAYPLRDTEYTIGRALDSGIQINSFIVSRVHAQLVREGSGYRYIQLGDGNPTLFAGRPVDERLLKQGDLLEIAPGSENAVTLSYGELSDFEVGGDLGQTVRGVPTAGDVPGPTAIETLSLPSNGVLRVGRAPTNDLVLPSLHVSREHAHLTINNGMVVFSDSGSANGSFVNGLRTEHRRLASGDVLRIGSYKLVFRGDAIEHVDDSQSVRLDAHQVSKDIGGKALLNGISFVAHPGEVLAIAGSSGAGKSTLLDALNGMRPPTSGHVLINGADIYRAYDSLRPLIGYVPQKSILPERLPVQRALQYVAHLRLPADVDSDEAAERVADVMRQLELTASADVEIDRMSGGEQKRASIAAELIASPGLFFLDEPTSGLDPGLTRRVNEIIRGLANRGATIVIITHDVEILGTADKMLMLGRGGRVVFNGSPPDAERYFEVSDLADIYRSVEANDSEAWAQRLVESPHYKDKVAPHLVEAVPNTDGTAVALKWDPVALISGVARQGSSAWRQFRITTTRYIESMVRDRAYFGLLLLQAPIVALAIALTAKSTDLQPPAQNAIFIAVATGLPAAKLASPLTVILAATATWFGAINASRELVKELPIYLRERMAGLRLAPYLASKVVVLAALCVVQTTLLLGIVAFRVDLPDAGAAMWAPLELWITLNLASLAALGLGLLISASVSNANRAQGLVPIVLIPQLIFLGGPGTGTVGQWLSYFTITHWSVEAMKISSRIPYLDDLGGYAVADLVGRWLALAAMTFVFLALTTWQVSRRRSL